MILLSTPSVIRPMIYETLDWGRKWLVDFNAGELQVVFFDQSNSTSAIDGRMDGSDLEEK